MSITNGDVMRVGYILIFTLAALFRPGWLYFRFFLQLNFQLVPKKNVMREGLFDYHNSMGNKKFVQMFVWEEG